MRNYILAIAAMVGLGGCASTYMEGLVGKPLQSAMAQYGPPSLVFDMPDGRRAFQWEMTSTGVMPQTTTTNANFYAPPGAFASMNATQTTYGGQSFSKTCRYTMYATLQDQTWTFTGFEKPSLSCQ